MAPGVALFDYDNDGDLDVYLVQGRMLGHRHAADRRRRQARSRDRLFRNDLEVEPTARARCTSPTSPAQAASSTRGYGMGVATGDFDNDGCVDLYLTGFGRNQLFRNNGNGTFTDVSTASGTDDPRSGASRRRSSTTIATAGSICSSATT